MPAPETSSIRTCVFGTLLVGCLATWGSILYTTSSIEPRELPGICLMLMWTLGPFLLVGYVAHALSASRRSLWTLQAAAVVLTVGGAIVLYQAFIAGTPDAQSGIAVLFLPAGQLAASVPFLIVAFALRDTKVPPN